MSKVYNINYSYRLLRFTVITAIMILAAGMFINIIYGLNIFKRGENEFIGPMPTPTPAATTQSVTEAPPDGNTVSLILSKVLAYEDGTLGGDGKKFAVRLYDEDMNMIERVILSANEDNIFINGLESGATYYLREEEGEGFTLSDIKIIGEDAVYDDTAELYIPDDAEDNGGIWVIIKNIISDLSKIPDEPPDDPDSFTEEDEEDEEGYEYYEREEENEEYRDYEEDAGEGEETFPQTGDENSDPRPLFVILAFSAIILKYLLFYYADS